MKYLYGFILLSGTLDLYSTLIQKDWKVEENPLFRWIWREWGAYGFIVVKLGLTLLFITLINLAIKKIGHKWLWVLVGILGGGLTLLIALTNLAWVDYRWTSWL